MTRMTRVSGMTVMARIPQLWRNRKTGPRIMGCLGMIGITRMTVMTGMRRLTGKPGVTWMAKI